MSTPATTIDEAITFCDNNIAAVSYGDPPPSSYSLFTQMGLWIDGMFGPAGIFPPSVQAPGQRVVTNWYAQQLIAIAQIEGPAAGDAELVGTCAVINAVIRALYAVKYSTINGTTTSAQETAVVALFNTCWSLPAPITAATLHTNTMTPAVAITNGVPSVWNAILTWFALGTIGNGKKLNYAETVRAPDLEVRDNQRYDVGTSAWVPAIGTVGVCNGDVASVTVADIEAAINSVSALAQVTTHDVAHAAYKGVGNTECEGTFSGGV